MCADQRIQLLTRSTSTSELLACISPAAIVGDCKCNICSNEICPADEENRKLVCGYFFHLHCIKAWFLDVIYLANKDKCPVCSRVFFVVVVLKKFC